MDEEPSSTLYFHSKFKSTTSAHTNKMQGLKFFIIHYVMVLSNLYEVGATIDIKLMYYKISEKYDI